MMKGMVVPKIRRASWWSIRVRMVQGMVVPKIGHGSRVKRLQLLPLSNRGTAAVVRPGHARAGRWQELEAAPRRRKRSQLRRRQRGLRGLRGLSVKSRHWRCRCRCILVACLRGSMPQWHCLDAPRLLSTQLRWWCSSAGCVPRLLSARHTRSCVFR